MQIDKPIKLSVTASLLLLLTSVQVPADPTTEQNNGSSDTLVQSPPETPTTEPGEKSAEGGDNSEGRDYKPFTPSETISADSAIAFPVDI